MLGVTQQWSVIFPLFFRWFPKEGGGHWTQSGGGGAGPEEFRNSDLEVSMC